MTIELHSAQIEELLRRPSCTNCTEEIEIASATVPATGKTYWILQCDCCGRRRVAPKENGYG